ncbi:MAG: family 1 glycosylhydrolase, partial [Angelakisella sp.]
QGSPKTAIGWHVNFDCLYWGSRFLYERYQKPIIITENGMSSHDWVSLDGKVHDPQRIDYLHRHLRWLKQAVDEGVDVAGYFQWSFLDNFEWCNGYNDRFGIVYTDYATQQRIPKDSYHWYRQVIAQNGECL